MTDGRVLSRTSNTFSGYRNHKAQEFVAEAQRYFVADLLDQMDSKIKSAMTEWHLPLGKDQYLTLPLYRSWLEKFGYMCVGLYKAIQEDIQWHPQFAGAAELYELLISGGELREACNDAWVVRQRKVHSVLFASAFGYPLSDEQVEAILRDEHRSLIVAGAGTGKTSTIVAKARWIQAQGLSTQSRVKILTFNGRAQSEINERLGTNANDDRLASTFHALGLSLVARA